MTCRIKTFSAAIFLRGGAHATMLAPILATVLSASTAGQMLTGTVTWSDAQGVAHPARNHRVEIYAPVEGPTHLARVYTNLQGMYTSTYAVPPGGYTAVGAHPQADTGLTPGGGYVFPYPPANQPTRPPAPVGMFFGDTIYEAHGDIGGSGGVIDFALPRVPAEDNINRAFSISDAMFTGWYFSSQVRATPAPELSAMIGIPLGDTTAYRNDDVVKRIWINANDWAEWDVLLHEYGHYLTDPDIDNLGILNLAVGGHSIGVSNITGGPGVPALGKERGMRLAWAEGLASYLGIAAQHTSPLSQNLPTNMNNVGDTQYQDETQDLEFDLESHANNQMATEAGEGDELPIGRILWDLADPSLTEPHDRVDLGHIALYNILNNNIPNGTLDRIEDVWDYFFTISSDAQRPNYGAIFEEYGISPHPGGSSPIDVSLFQNAPPPTFDWMRGNDNANDAFQLIVFKGDLSQRVLDIAVAGDVNTYTLTNSQWNTLRNMPGAFKFVIAGSDAKDATGALYAADLQTGAYWSDAQTFYVIPEPGACTLASLALALCFLHRRRTFASPSAR